MVACPHPELRRLDPLVGKWTVEGQARESIAGPACAVRSNETFEWLDGGYFLVHRYETYFGDRPVQRGVMFWGYDAATEGFLLHFFSNNGPFTVGGNIYEGDIRGNALICSGPARFAIPLDHDGRILVNGNETFETSWELRDSTGVWRPWMRDTYWRTT